MDPAGAEQPKARATNFGSVASKCRKMDLRLTVRMLIATNL
mgnify:CR=1 FL=1|jgi:hypothetical protein